MHVARGSSKASAAAPWPRRPRAVGPAWMTLSAPAKKGLCSVAEQGSGEGGRGRGPGLLLRGAPQRTRVLELLSHCEGFSCKNSGHLKEFLRIL